MREQDELLTQFTEDATVTRLDARGERPDVAKFWQEYRRSFSVITTPRE